MVPVPKFRVIFAKRGVVIGCHGINVWANFGSRILVSEGIEVAGEVADKIKGSKNKKCGGFPYKTVLLTLGIGALVVYALAKVNTAKKKS